MRGSEAGGVGAEVLGVDLRSLAALRVGLAVVTLADLALRCRDFSAHYTDAGWLPLAELGRVEAPRLLPAPHLVSGVASWQAALFVVHAIVAVLMLVGLRTGLATAGCWFLTLSLQARNPGVLDGADMLLRMLLFWSMFLPLGATWSLDARRDPTLRGPPRTIVSTATVALLMQAVLLYEFAALTKLQPEWLQGDGVYYALHLDQLVLAPGRWLRDHPGLLGWLNGGVLAFELVGPWLLLWPGRSHRPVRLAAMAGFLALQVGFGLTIRLHFFPWVSTLALVPFVPGALWDRLGFGPRSGEATEPVEAAPPALSLARPLAILVAAASLYVAAWNAASLPEPPFQLPGWLRLPGLALRLDQSWYLFSPPWKADGWYVVTGVTPEGRELDLATGEPASFASPGDTWARFATHRTWAYMRFLRARAARPLRGPYLRARRRERPEVLLVLRLWYVMEATLPDGVILPPERGLLHEERTVLGARTVARPRPQRP